MDECIDCKLPGECEKCERWVCSRCEEVKPWDNGSSEPELLCDECFCALGYGEEVEESSGVWVKAEPIPTPAAWRWMAPVHSLIARVRRRWNG